MKHTQGDWKAEWTHSESNIKKGWHIITGNYDDIIDIPNAPEAEANAKLIAAAPQLLQALQAFQEMFIHREGETKKNKIKTDVIKYCDEVKEALNNARSIIQKATN